jgi:hypothetical protein
MEFVNEDEAALNSAWKGEMVKIFWSDQVPAMAVNIIVCGPE